MPVKTLPVRLLLILRHLPEWEDEQHHSVHVLGRLDSWGHKRDIPKIMQSPLCDAWDWYLGVYDDDEPMDLKPAPELQ